MLRVTNKVLLQFRGVPNFDKRREYLQLSRKPARHPGDRFGDRVRLVESKPCFLLVSPAQHSLALRIRDVIAAIALADILSSISLLWCDASLNIGAVVLALSSGLHP